MESHTYIDAVTQFLEDMKFRGTVAVPISEENRRFLRQLYQSGRTKPSQPKATRPLEVSPPPAPPPPVPVESFTKPPAPSTPSPLPSSNAPVREAFKPAAMVETGAMDWEELERTANACQACGLCNGRTNVVFGTGNRNAEVMFIGEGPGYDEDQQGIPFVGKAGQLLTKIIQAMQFERDDVYIANIIKCRPPNNRNPQPEEADACIHYLTRQIELVNPKVIVLLGAVPLQFLMNVRGIMRSRGQWLSYESIPVMPTYHPSFLLRKPENKRAVWEDMQQVMVRLGKTPPGQT